MPKCGRNPSCEKLAIFFCNNLTLLLSLSVFAIILPQKVGCGQKLEQSLFHTSSSSTQQQPTKTGLGSDSFSSTTFADIQFADKNMIILGGENDEKGVENNDMKRNKRQILQPIRHNFSFKSKIPGSRDDMNNIMLHIHIDFISDLAVYKGWPAIYIILPGNSVQLCEYFSAMLAKSEANLLTECGNEGMNVTAHSVDIKGFTLSRRRVMPVFSFYFLNSSSGGGGGGSLLMSNPTLLVPFTPTRPTFLLGGMMPIAERDGLVGKVQPMEEGNCKWTLIWAQEDVPTNLILEDVYGFPGMSPLTQVMGKWTPEEGLHIDTELALGPVDFQGRTLKITTVAGPPVVFVTKTSKGVKSTGYLPDIIKIISSQLNFTYEVMTPPDNQFGNVGANQSWSGMVGMLQRKEAHIAMMSFSLTASRSTVMDFSPPVEYSSVRLLIRRDWQNAELKWSAYLRPLELDVWATIPIFVILGVITLAIFSYFKVLEISPFTSAWLLTSCFILQGQDEHSVIKVTPYRLVLGTFWVLSVVVFACYTARLTAFLAASNEVLPISSLYQAVRNRNWKVGLVKGSAFIDRIKESQADVLRRLYHRITDDSSALVDSFQEGMDKVFKERYIFFTSELIPSFLIRSNCSYTWLPDKYFSGFGYMGYQKNLPFSPVISQRIAELRQSGQMKRLFQKWWGTDSVCFTNSGEAFLGMSLYETGTAFLILLGGLSLAITLILAEFYTGRRHRGRFRSATSEFDDKSKTSGSQIIIPSSKNPDAFPQFFKKSEFSF